MVILLPQKRAKRHNASTAAAIKATHQYGASMRNDQSAPCSIAYHSHSVPLAHLKPGPLVFQPIPLVPSTSDFPTN